MRKNTILTAGAAVIAFVAGCACMEAEYYHRIVDSINDIIDSDDYTSEEKLDEIRYLSTAILALIETGTFTRNKYGRLYREMTSYMERLEAEIAEAENTESETQNDSEERNDKNNA